MQIAMRMVNLLSSRSGTVDQCRLIDGGVRLRLAEENLGQSIKRQVAV
jgi:hypothetical protein